MLPMGLGIDRKGVGPTMTTSQPRSREPTSRSITDEALVVWSELLRLHATVTDVLERDLTARTGLSMSWYDVLLQLREAPGGRLRMQELASAVVLSRSGLTRLVDRLERAGYVARTSCASDARGTFAEITQAGSETLRRARPVHLQGVGEHFTAHLSLAELTAMGQSLAKLLAAHGVAAVDEQCCHGARVSEKEAPGEHR